MTLTNKDKMMLVILAIVIFVAVFYMYGIVPANDALDASEVTIKNKQAEVDALNLRLAATNTSKIDKSYNDLLEFYYANNQKVLDEEIPPTYIDEMMFQMFDDCGITGYSSTSWYPVQTATLTAIWDGTSVAYNTRYIDCSTSFTIPADNTIAAVAVVNTLLDTIEANPSMQFTDFNFSIAESTQMVDDDDNPDTPDVEVKTMIFNGSFTLRYTMQIEINTDNIPALLANVTSLTNNGGTTISFGAVENAVSYEFYSFTEGADGNRYYTLIQGASLKPSSNAGILTYTFKADAATGTQNVIVRAVGDKSAGNFKSPLNNSVPYTSVTFG